MFTADVISPNGTSNSDGEPMKIQRYHPATEIVMVDGCPSDENSQALGGQRHFNASSMPIYQTATFKQTSATRMGEYDYSRSGNPTRSYMENHLAKIMSARRAFAVTSGMAALDVITRLVATGSEIIAGDDLYGGTNRLLTHLSTHSGIKVHHVDTTNVEAVLEKVNEHTALVLLETPTNPLIKIADIKQICTKIHAQRSGIIVAVDNTMMSPYLQRPLELGADIVYHSGTKYLSGHHDLMAGIIGVADEKVAEVSFFFFTFFLISCPAIENLFRCECYRMWSSAV